MDGNKSIVGKVFVRRKIGVYGNAQNYFMELNGGKNKFKETETRRLFQFFRIERVDQVPQFRPHFLLHCFFIDDPITQDMLRNLSIRCKKYNLIHVGCKRQGEENHKRTLKDVIFPYEVEDFEDFVCLMQDIGAKVSDRFVRTGGKSKKKKKNEEEEGEEEEEDLEPIFFQSMKDSEDSKKKPSRRSFSLLRIFNSRNNSQEEEIEKSVIQSINMEVGGDRLSSSAEVDSVSKLDSIDSENQNGDVVFEKISSNINQRPKLPNIKRIEEEFVSPPSSISEEPKSIGELFSLESLQEKYNPIHTDEKIEETLQSLQVNEKSISHFLGLDQKHREGKKGNSQAHVLPSKQDDISALPIREVVKSFEDVKKEGESLKDTLEDYQSKIDHFETFCIPLLKYLQEMAVRCRKYKKRINFEKSSLLDNLSQLDEGNFSRFEIFDHYRAEYRKLIGYRKNLMRKLLAHQLSEEEEESFILELVESKNKLERIQKDSKKGILEIFLPAIDKKFAEIRREVKREEGKKKKEKLKDILRCPMTKRILIEPYILTATGETCEKKELQVHFSQSVDHPFRIGQRLKHTGIVPNLTIKEVIRKLSSRKK